MHCVTGTLRIDWLKKNGGHERPPFLVSNGRRRLSCHNLQPWSVCRSANDGTASQTWSFRFWDCQVLPWFIAPPLGGFCLDNPSEPDTLNVASVLYRPLGQGLPASWGFGSLFLFKSKKNRSSLFAILWKYLELLKVASFVLSKLNYRMVFHQGKDGML